MIRTSMDKWALDQKLHKVHSLFITYIRSTYTEEGRLLANIHSNMIPEQLTSMYIQLLILLLDKVFPLLYTSRITNMM